MYTFNRDGKVVLKKDELTGLPQFVDNKFAWNTVLNDLHEVATIDQLYNKVDELAANNLMYAAIRDKLTRILNNSKSSDHKVATDAEVLLTNIWGIVHSHIHDFVTVKTTQLDNGGNSVRIIDNTVDVKARTLPSQWGQQLMRDTIFSFDKDGHVQWSKDGKHKLDLLLRRFDLIKEALTQNKMYKPKDENIDLNTAYGLARAKSDIVRIFNMLGVTIDLGTLDQALKSRVYGTDRSTEKDRLI
jgi:hypothetical protein